MALKWIVTEDNDFRIGNVVLHRDFFSKEEDVKCLGGGYFTLIDDNMLLYSSSHDFGQITEEQFKNMYIKPALAFKYKHIYFSISERLDHALDDYKKGKLISIKL